MSQLQQITLRVQLEIFLKFTRKICNNFFQSEILTGSPVLQSLLQVTVNNDNSNLSYTVNFITHLNLQKLVCHQHSLMTRLFPLVKKNS